MQRPCTIKIWRLVKLLPGCRLTSRSTCSQAWSEAPHQPVDYRLQAIWCTPQLLAAPEGGQRFCCLPCCAHVLRLRRLHLSSARSGTAQLQHSTYQVSAACVPCRTDYLLFWFWIDVLACLPVQCMLTSWAPNVVWWNLGYTNRCAC